MQDVNALIQKYNLSDAIKDSKFVLANVQNSRVSDRSAMTESLEPISSQVGGNIVDEFSDSDFDWFKEFIFAWAI
jgi:hypothetical protein